MRELEEARQKALKLFSTSSNWIQWLHPGIPDQPESYRLLTRILAVAFGHCVNCTALSGCYFIDEVPTKCPQYPLHENCHCEKKQANIPAIVASCPLEKFTGYIFAEKYAKNGKRKLFEQLGFLIEDSDILRSEYERQAAEKYAVGDYQLGNLDYNGQRINISIEFTHPTRGIVTFVSGWMIHPKGYITCNTPLGG